MPSRILCPECEAAFAFSPALLGETVQCPRCAHRFAVSSPPVEELPVAVLAPQEPGRELVPPPLPARGGSERPPVAERDAPAEDRPRRRLARRERSGNAGVLAGLAAAFVLGSIVIIGGLVYMLWPRTSKPTNPAGPGPSPAAVAPVDPEPARRFEDIVREAPHKDDNRDRAGPEVPQFNPAPIGPRLESGPKFTPVVPLPIGPTRLARDRDEMALPGPVESVAVAGGGRFLLLHIPRVKQVAVFDVREAKVVREISVPDPNVLVAGGMNLFVIYQPGKNTIERWNCDRLEQQPTAKFAFTDPVKALAMGCASNGPLVAAVGGSRRTQLKGATLAYFDPVTFREIEVVVGGVDNPFGIGPADKTAIIRASANGKVVTGWSPERPTGTECDVIDGRRVTRHWNLHAPSQLLPGPDGALLFGRGETFRHDMQGGRGPQWDSPVIYVPAISGNWYVVVRGPRLAVPGDDVRAEVVTIHQVGKNAPAVTFDAVDDIDLSRAEQGLDQTVILVPEAKVLITVAGPKRTRLVLRRVELK